MQGHAGTGVHTHVYKHDGRGMREGKVQTQQERDEGGRRGRGQGRMGAKGIGLYVIIRKLAH